MTWNLRLCVVCDGSCGAFCTNRGGGGARKRHILPHPAQPQHTNHWAPRTRKRHQQQHRPQQPTESATRRNMRREERGTVQGPVKKQQPDGMSHRGVLDLAAARERRGKADPPPWQATIQPTERPDSQKCLTLQHSGPIKGKAADSKVVPEKETRSRCISRIFREGKLDNTDRVLLSSVSSFTQCPCLPLPGAQHTCIIPEPSSCSCSSHTLLTAPRRSPSRATPTLSLRLPDAPSRSTSPSRTRPASGAASPMAIGRPCSLSQ